MANENMKRIEEISRQAQQQLEKIRREFGLLNYVEQDQPRAPPSQPCEQPRGQASAGPDFWSELARVKAQYGVPADEQEQPARTPPPSCAPCPRKPSPVPVRAPSPVHVPQEQARSQPSARPTPDFWTEMARVKAKYISPQGSPEQERPRAPPPSSPPCPRQPSPAAASRPSPVRTPEQARSSPSALPPTDFWTELARVKAQYVSPPPPQQTAAPRAASPVPCPLHQQQLTARTPSPARPVPPQQVAAPRTPSPASCPEQPRQAANSPDFWSELARVKAQYASPPERSTAPLQKTPVHQQRVAPQDLTEYQSPGPASLPPPMMPSCPQRPYVIPGLPRGPRPTTAQERAKYKLPSQHQPVDERTVQWATAAAEAEDYWDPQYSTYYDEGPLPNPFLQDETVEEFDPLYSGGSPPQCPGHYR